MDSDIYRANNAPSTSNQTIQPAKPLKPKKDIINHVVICVLLLLVIGLTTYIIIDKVGSKQNDASPVPEEIAKTGENDIDSVTLRDDLSQRASVILTTFSHTSDLTIYQYPVLYNNLDSLANLSDNVKIALAFSYANGSANYDKYLREMNIEDAKAWLGDDANPTNIENTIGMYQIYPNYDIQPTVDAAKKLFGYEIKLDDDIYLTETNWMEDVYYSPKTKALYYSVGGGDVVAPRYIYKYKFSTEDNKAYVYFAFVQCDPSIYDNTPSGTCIDGFGDSVVYADDIVDGITNDTIIDKFKHYRLIFEDDGSGNYIYKTAERVE